MARSLRDLVEFLLEEISLCGAQGATPANILEFIDEYYASPVRITSNYVNKRTAKQKSDRTPKIDRPFKEKVWTWLTRNPEVSVGKDREGNSLSLSEVLGPDYVWPEHSELAKQTGQVEGASSAGGNAAATPTPVVYPAGVTVPESVSPAKKGASSESKPKHHVFVTEERMWLAITGHGPDPSKVLPMEFALLSIIASQKGSGIIQPELVKVSGQDKRSVPKRTDILKEKGYIEKKPIQFKSSRTSLCTLKKFIGRPSYLDGSFKTPAERGKDRKHAAGDVIDFKVLLDNIFKCLKEYNVISRDDLKSKLGMTDGWRWRILSRALRKLERIGCLKRLRAQSQYKMKTYHSSVMLIREPTERDLQLFHENCNSLMESIENEEGMGQDLEEGEELSQKARSKTSPPSKGAPRPPKKENVEETGRIIPRWTPGRSLANMIFEIIDKAGPRGISNHDIRTLCFGNFLRRSLESFLSRLVDCWQYSQPPHLRHLALIRDTALRGTIIHYVHYSYNNFKHLVDTGQASWEAVEYIPKGPKGKAGQVPAIDAVPQFDENGFPIRSKAHNLLNDGEATLGECQAVLKPGNYFVSNSDPVVVKMKDGSYKVKRGHRKLTNGTLKGLEMATKGTSETTRKRKTPGALPNGVVEVFTPDGPGPAKRQKKGVPMTDPFEGMSQREILIAKGYDESWTEFCACVQERPHPGVYITPRGKRRAGGGRQGRPRISRIAVFKSEKLKELSWFTAPAVTEEPTPKGRSTPENDKSGLPTRRGAARKRKAVRTIADSIGPESTADDDIVSGVGEEAQATNGETATADGNSEALAMNNRERAEEVSGMVNSIEVGDDEPQPKPKRGRPRKNSPRPPKTTKAPGRPRKGAKNCEKSTADDNSEILAANKRKRSEEVSEVANSIEVDDEPQPKRKRGRPRKDSQQPPRGRGRPRGGSQKTTTPVPAQQEGDAARATTTTSERLATFSQEAAEQPHIPIENTISPRPSTAQEDVATNSSAQLTHGPTQNISPIPVDTVVEMVDSSSTNIAEPSSERKEPTPPPESQIDTSHTSPSPNRAATESVEIECGASETVTPKNTEVSDSIALPEETPSQRTTKELSVGQDTTNSNSEAIGRQSQPTDKPEKSGLRMRKTRAGSVAFLRKKIVMELVEKSGGIFPLGKELWYPFTTAWLKAGQTVKPDLRTVRSTVKSLVDSGKLRQLTFSGKDSKGVMSTRNMVTLSEVEPTDTRILEMQKAILSKDNYIPPGVEVDPNLRKSRSTLPPKNKTKGAWPEIDPNVTVTLHQKPAAIRTQELRKSLSAQRRLRRGSDMPEALQRVRIGRIGRPSGRAPGRPRGSAKLSALGQLTTNKRSGTSNGFQAILDFGSQKSGSRKRRQPISAMYPYSMLMCPAQSFHPSTGTFLTGDCSPIQYVPEQAGFLPSGLAEAIENKKLFGIRKYKDLDERSSVFFSKVESISKWENTIDAVNYQTTDWNFINHTVQGEFESVPLRGPIFYDRDLPPIRRTPLEPKALRPLMPAQNIPARAPQGLYQHQSNFRRPELPIAARSDISSVGPASELDPAPKPKKRRSRNTGPAAPVSRRLSKLAEEQENSKLEQNAVRAPGRPIIARRNRFAKNLPRAVIQKIMMAISVVRALAGGIEGKMVEWGIVTKLFPEYDAKFVQERGRTIMSSNRLQMAKMQSDFQDRFAEAYEKGTVPSIDYGNLMDYDWEYVVNWANTQLETPTTTVRKLPNLPATRRQFDSLFEIRKDPPQLLNDMYQYNATVTLPRKRALLAGRPFALPLQESDEPPRKRQKSERLDAAKTWVRANVLAPEETYNPTEARRTLEDLFGESLVDSALRSLVSERSISACNKRRPVPGRNYDITDLFLNVLGRKRALESKQLKRAAYFKVNILDEDFRTKGQHDLKYEAEDGDILVIINLLAEGRLVLQPRDPPKNKYGLTDGGYLTRLMDKNKLRFGIDVFPVPDKYVYGNPMQEIVASVPAPRGDLDRSIAALSQPTPQPGEMAAPPPPSATAGKIPVWFDIHSRFIRVTWDLAIAAVIGIVAGRQGISTKEIATVVSPSMGEWEIELALEWMVKVGLVEKTRESSETAEGKVPGWSVKEWWWLAIGEREGVKNSSDKE